MTGIEWRDRLAEQFGCLLKRWSRIETRNRNVFVPAYANILPNILDLVLGTTLKRKNSEQWDCDDFADDDRRIAVQIRTNSSFPGARRTLNLYREQGLTEKYDRLVMLVLATSLRNLRETLNEDYFSPEKDLWSLEDLYHRIQELEDIQKGERICGYLDQMLEVPFEKPKNLLQIPPRYTDTFEGRETELIDLRNRLTEKKPIFITGVGGIGKTEVALRMAHLFAPPKGAYFLCYNNAIDEEKEVIRQVILNAKFSGDPILQQGSDNEDQNYAKRMEIIRKQYRDAMLIIDNLDLQKKRVQDIQNEDSYRELVDSGVCLVFTTRYAAEGLEIKGMDPKVLLKLMRKYCPSTSITDQKLLKLIEAVDCHTLVAVLSAQTITSSWGRITPDILLDKFKKKDNDKYSGRYPLVKMDRNGEISNGNINEHLSVVFQVSELSEEDRTILRYAALLPDEGLPKELFWKAIVDCTQAEEEPRYDVVNKITEIHIDSVVARGWLKKVNDTIMIHPVIRDVCLRELKPTDENDRNMKEYLSAVVQISELSEEDRTILRYAALLPDEGSPEELFWKAMVDCAQAEEEPRYDAANGITKEYINSVVARGWLKKVNDTIMIHPVIRNVCMRELRPTDENDRNMKEYLSAVVQISELSEEDRTILRYAALLPDEGFSEELFWKAMVDCAQTEEETRYDVVNACTEEHIDSVISHGWMKKENGMLMIHPVIRNVCLREMDATDDSCGGFLDALWLQYKPKEYSKETYRQLAKLFQMATNKLEDREGIWCLRAGLFWYRLGELDQALECFRKTVKRQSTSTYNTVDLVRTHNKIGAVYQAMDRIEEAHESFLRAKEIAEKDPKSDLYIRAMTLNNLGSVCGDLGEYDDALKYRKDALKILEKEYPENHPALAASYSNIASIYSALGDYVTSLEYHLKALDIREVWNGAKEEQDEDLVLAKTYNNVGGNYLHLRDYMKAQDYMLKALMIRERLLPDGHPDLVRSYNNMGGLYIRMGDDEKALEYLKKALELRKRAFLDEYLGLATIHNNMAAIYIKKNDFAEGLEHLYRALELQERVEPPVRPDIAQTHKNIAWTYYGMGDYSEAKKHIEKAMEIAKAALPADHADLEMYRRAESRIQEKLRMCLETD